MRKESMSGWLSWIGALGAPAGEFSPMPDFEPSALSFAPLPVEVLVDLMLRQRAARHTAIGWLSFERRRGGSSAALGGTRIVKRKSGQVVGRVVLGDNSSGLSVTITNSSGGMAKLDAQHGIVRQALGAARRDMLEYIARRAGERARSELKKEGGRL